MLDHKKLCLTHLLLFFLFIFYVYITTQPGNKLVHIFWHHCQATTLSFLRYTYVILFSNSSARQIRALYIIQYHCRVSIDTTFTAIISLA